ncbi:flagellar hook-length control protein FliK [Desulfococcus sp.]|uniref:flagellar hook-length control protein FliK n=1 Tax=Desulfococcus sp. TaxID=2025834 RepID=UPI003593AF79
MLQATVSAGDGTEDAKPPVAAGAAEGTQAREGEASPPEEAANALESHPESPDDGAREAVPESGDGTTPEVTAGAGNALEAPEVPENQLVPLRAPADIPDGPAAMTETAAPAEVLPHVVDQARFTARGETSEIVILLRPEALGSLQVRVTSDSRKVSVRILAEKASAAEIMAAHGAQLRADLDAAGLEMGDLEISVASDDRDFSSQVHAGKPFGQIAPVLPAGKGLPSRGRIDFFA